MSEDSPLRFYDADFAVTPEYRASLPDMQNRNETTIPGGKVPLLQVGMSNFRLPLRIARRGNAEPVSVEASVTGTVSLDAEHKGINMSRIVRIFYEFQDEVFAPATLEKVLARYLSEIGSSRAQVRLDFNYPILQKSLRSQINREILEKLFSYNVSNEKMLIQCGPRKSARFIISLWNFF